MWQVYCAGPNGGVMAMLPDEKRIRLAFAHCLRDRKTQTHEFQLKNPDGVVVQTARSGLTQGKGKKG